MGELSKRQQEILQAIIEEEQQISNSAVRVDFPFLFNGGFIKEYKKDKIELNNFFTNEGLSYYEVIKIKKALDKTSRVIFSAK